MTIAASTALEMQRPVQRIENLDALRFLAAMWVVLSHGALPLKQLFSDPVARWIGAAFSSTFNGPAAVMVFFIVSGICIHWPYVDSKKLPVVNFLFRRYIRIGIPLIAILVFAHFLGDAAGQSLNAVLWSVYAEIIYYTLYPIFFILARSYGWGLLICCASLVSVSMVLAHLDYSNMQQFKYATWLWGLPIWLSGCLLAERFRQGKFSRGMGPILLWRMAAWGLGAVAIVLTNNSWVKIGAPVSMLLFSIFVYFWLCQEFRRDAPVYKNLNRFGSAGYSLYLVHNVAMTEYDQVLDKFQPILSLPARWLAIGIATYVFYTFIEAPAHRMARWAAQGASLKVVKTFYDGLPTFRRMRQP